MMTSSLQQIVGRIVPIHRGTYIAEDKYQPLDEVFYNGSSYRVKFGVDPPIGTAPNNSDFWVRVANQGPKIDGASITGDNNGALDLTFHSEDGSTFTVTTPDLTGDTGVSVEDVTITDNLDYTYTFTFEFSDATEHAVTTGNIRGPIGSTPTLSEGTATTLNPGDPFAFSLTNNGGGNYSLNLSVPKGNTGDGDVSHPVAAVQEDEILAAGNTEGSLLKGTGKKISDFNAVAFSGLYTDITGTPSLGAVATSNDYTDLDNKPTLGTVADKNTGTGSGNIPILDGSGKLSTSVLPDLVITDTFTAADQTAMLALTAQKGDVCIRTDVSKTFILASEPASTLANWKELPTPASGVTSVAGLTDANITASDLRTALNVADGADVTATALAGASGAIHGATAKTTLVANDEFLVADSAASWVTKRSTMGNVASYLYGATGTWTAKQTMTGGASFSGATTGIDFGSTYASSYSDLAKQIALYSTTYGFAVLNGSLNYNVPSAATHTFYSGTTKTLDVSSSVFQYKGTNVVTGDLASATEVLYSTNDKIVTSKGITDARASVTTATTNLAASWNIGQYNTVILTLSGNGAINNPSTTYAGYGLVTTIIVRTTAAGPYTVSFGTNFILAAGLSISVTNTQAWILNIYRLPSSGVTNTGYWYVTGSMVGGQI